MDKMGVACLVAFVSLNSYTAAIPREAIAGLRRLLEERGYEFGTKPYAYFSAKQEQVSVTVYEKGPKVLIQGKGTEDFVKFILEPEILQDAVLGYDEIKYPDRFEPHFGIDESGKGDYFGPLVIAGAYTDKTIARRLLELGVMDSKKISSAAKIKDLAQKIREVPNIAIAVVSIGPERYNEMHQKIGNLNRLLAWGHVRVLGKLVEQKPDCPRSLSDQFAKEFVLLSALKGKGLRIQVEQRTKAESDLAVAAASIVARHHFVDWMERASQAGGVRLPLGASAAVITAANEVVAKHGPEMLSKVAKIHFKTTQSVKGL